jgi:hypothetical protein
MVIQTLRTLITLILRKTSFPITTLILRKTSFSITALREQDSQLLRELYSLLEDQVTPPLREYETDQLRLEDLIQDILALNGQELLDVKTRS